MHEMLAKSAMACLAARRP